MQVVNPYTLHNNLTLPLTSVTKRKHFGNKNCREILLKVQYLACAIHCPVQNYRCNTLNKFSPFLFPAVFSYIFFYGKQYFILSYYCIYCHFCTTSTALLWLLTQLTFMLLLWFWRLRLVCSLSHYIPSQHESRAEYCQV